VNAHTTTTRIRALAVTAAIAAGGCGPMPENLDPHSALDKEPVGRPVMSLRWKRVLEDTGRERKPQEFASAEIVLGPSRDRDTLYLGSNRGVLHAFAADTGRQIWHRKLGSVSSKPIAHRGRLYVGTDDGYLYCLDTFSGDKLWQYLTKGPVLEAPVIAGDLVIFSNENDHVYALDRASGSFRWKYKVDTPDDGTLRGHAGVSADEDLIYAGFSNGSMVALRQATGSVAWLASLKGGEEQFVDVDVTPVVSTDTVFAASTSGGLYALDKSLGRVKWRLPIKGVGALATDDQRLFAIAANQGAYALDLAGNIIWRQGTAGGGEPAGAVLSGDYLLYSLSEDGLFIVDKASGRLVQFFDPGYGISSVPSLARDAMYVLSNSAILYALSLRHYP
jgi:outer membrane protein assembly factor BamB